MKALVIVDVQRDFLPGGALGVDDGFAVIDGIVEAANATTTNAEGEIAPVLVVTTQDWHPYETAHFETWPRHCVKGSPGADLDVRIANIAAPYAFFKGDSDRDDGYSGFEGFTPDAEPLNAILHREGVTEVEVVGLALDYCVKATALDAAKRGYDVTVPLALTRPVAQETGDLAIRDLEQAGVKVIYENACPNCGEADPALCECPTTEGGD